MFLLLVLTVLLYWYFGLTVNNALSGEDIAAIRSLQVRALCVGTDGDFGKEQACIKAIQQKVQAIGSTDCAARGETVEPKAFIRRGYGCCFDRARFIEKSLRHYGFQTRHVFLIQPSLGLSITNFLPLGQQSHATTEVLTVKGWLGVDSNNPFILMDEAGAPYTYERSLQAAGVKEKLVPRNFFSKPLDVIYGLYSRHGFFHGVNLPGPEINPAELVWNFL